MLATPPYSKRAIINDSSSDPDNVIITVGIRDIGTCELLIPKESYEPFALLQLVETMPDNGSEAGHDD